MKNIIQRNLSLLCVFLLLLSLCITTVVAVGINSVTATTSSSTIKQGNYANCYVYIDSAAELASLDVTVHYDNTKVSIVNTYNSINCTLYDRAVNADNISYNYIFDGNGNDSKTQLFYFEYRVLNNAEAGTSYFDISVGEAYDSDLNDVFVTGSRCKFTISESSTTKSCALSGTQTVSSSIDQEFSLSYRFNTCQLASGSAVITYDAELFEPVSVTPDKFLNDKITDINTDLVGSIYVSFVGSQYNSYYDFLTVTFKTIKNKNDISEIVMKVTDLCDLDLNAVSCSGYTTTANVVYDDSYTEDAPKMSVQADYLLESNQILATVYLEEDSHLGAGDFVLNFDTELMTLNSYEKKFNPTFFNVNDKNADEGKLKFSIISLEDITAEQTVLTAVFDCSENLSVETISVNIEGSGLSDSLTNPIKLNFIDGSDYIDYVVIFKDSDDSIISESVYQYGNTILIPSDPEKSDKIYTYVFDGWGKEVSETCVGNVVYTAIYECTYIDYLITFKNDDGTIHSEKTYHYGDMVEVPENPRKEFDSEYSYEFNGWDKEVTSVVEDTVYTAVYNSIEHSYQTVVTQPTCIDTGYTTYTCNCGYTYIADEVEVLGHNMGEYVVIADPTCTEIGLERSDCLRCDHFETNEIKATGHSYTSVVTPPNCTQIGYTTYTCHCNDTYIADEVDALGHSFTNYVSNNNATCLEDGTLTAKCDRCDVTDTITDEDSAFGHDMGEYVIIADPTCTEKGMERSDCSRCDHFVTREINATGHSYTSEVTPPNCTQAGYTTYTCHCGHTYTADKVSALGHDIITVKPIQPTCTSAGHTSGRFCSRCDYVIVSQKILPARGHNIIVDNAVASSCTSTGLTEGQHCSKCDEVIIKQEIVPALGHKKSDAIIEVKADAKCGQPGSYDRVICCYVCNVEISRETITVDALSHQYDEVVTAPTCTEGGYTTYTCKLCGDNYVDDEVSALGHNIIVDEAKEPTCTETGLTEGQHCSRCDDETVKQEDIPSLGHDIIIDDYIGPTCDESGFTEGQHCSRCDEATIEQRELPPLGHSPSGCVTENRTDAKCGQAGSYDSVIYCYVCNDEVSRVTITVDALSHQYNKVITSPTCTKAGYTTYTCSLCNDTYDDNEVSALGHDIVIDNAVEATCTKTGLTKGQHCSRCDEETIKQETVPMKAHNYVIKTDSSKHWKECVCGLKINEQNHTFNAEGICSCGYVRIVNSTITIKNNNGSKTIDYGETLKLTAIVKDKPSYATIVWYVDGIETSEGETFNITFESGTKTVEVKLLDENGNIIKDTSGNEISDSEEVTVKTGFFKKLISFFKNLFGMNRIVVQTILNDK